LCPEIHLDKVNSSYVRENILCDGRWTNQLMLFLEVICAYCENYVKHSLGRRQRVLILKQAVHIVTAVNVVIAVY
jgi:hypothetical protein